MQVNWRPWIWIGLAATGLAAACQHMPGDLAVSGAPPPVAIPVGPVPGPAHAQGLPANPYASSQGAMTEGRKLFTRYNCAGCHGDHAGGGMGPSLRDESWMYGGSDPHVFNSIAEGRAHGMPAWGTKISNDEIWKLVAYIGSLRTPAEPEAPPK